MRGPPAQLYSSVSSVLVKTGSSETESCAVSHDTTADTGHHNIIPKYVVKHKSAKLLMTYAVGKLEAGTLVH